MTRTLVLGSLTLVVAAGSFVGTRLYSQSTLAVLVPMHVVEQVISYRADGTLDHVTNLDSRRFSDGSFVQTTTTDNDAAGVLEIVDLASRQGLLGDRRTGRAETYRISDWDLKRRALKKNCIDNISPQPNMTISEDPVTHTLHGFAVKKITAISRLNSGAVFSSVRFLAPELGCTLMAESVYQGTTLVNQRTVVSLEISPQDRALLNPPNMQIVPHAEWDAGYRAARKTSE
jgi:hypothetical protein